jgi:hypothetical protein
MGGRALTFGWEFSAYRSIGTAAGPIPDPPAEPSPRGSYQRMDEVLEVGVASVPGGVGRRYFAHQAPGGSTDLDNLVLLCRRAV